MCGIVGHVGTGAAIDTLLPGLKNLEYRGYDSAGVAVKNGSGITVRKRSGKVEELAASLRRDRPAGNLGIGHTRWSTHGAPTDRNAHPHTSSDGDIAVVHNGVIENSDELRRRLERAGHEFSSETDTEVIPRVFEEHRRESDDVAAAFRRTVDGLEGSYAIAALVEGEEAIFAARKGSPLVVGVADGAYFLASDVPAFLEHTDSVVFLVDGDVAVIDPEGFTITDAEGRPVEREIEEVDWDPEEVGKGRFDHYMKKEIHAQPTALSNAIRGRIDAANAAVELEGFPSGSFADVRDVQFVGCGTSYHAALYAERLVTGMGVRAQAIRASEYQETADPPDDGTLVVAVTQSGETADTLGAVRRARERGARTLALTNVMGSSVTREADTSLFIRAGPEIGVAATKTFSSQAVTLSLLAHRIAGDGPSKREREDTDPEGLLDALSALPDHVDRVLAQSRARTVARRYLDHDAFFFIGRGLAYPVAMEGALKFKEITYEHAEGFPAGELKHGPLALVTPRTPVIAIFGSGYDEKTLTNAREAQTRGARLVAVAPDGHRATDVADDHLWIPGTHPSASGIVATVQLQLLAYHAADQIGRSIDKPRNLAKSVTVD